MARDEWPLGNENLSGPWSLQTSFESIWLTGRLRLTKNFNEPIRIKSMTRPLFYQRKSNLKMIIFLIILKLWTYQAWEFWILYSTRHSNTNSHKWRIKSMEHHENCTQVLWKSISAFSVDRSQTDRSSASKCCHHFWVEAFSPSRFFSNATCFFSIIKINK